MNIPMKNKTSCAPDVAPNMKRGGGNDFFCLKLIKDCWDSRNAIHKDDLSMLLKLVPNMSASSSYFCEEQNEHPLRLIFTLY